MSGTIESGDGFPASVKQNGTLNLPGDGVPSVVHDGSVSPIQIGGQAFRIQEHFAEASGVTLPTPWAKQDTSAAGSPVTDYVDDAAGGQYELALATDNEVETLTLYHGDQLMFDPTKKLIFQARLKIEPDITGASGAFLAGDILVAGLAQARNATLDSNAGHLWFRIEGANLDILVESDDGTTDDDDNDSGVDYVDDTWLELTIDASDLSAVKFYVDGVSVASLDASDLTGNVQPYIELQKAAAANSDHKVTVDFIDVIQQEL